MQLVSTLESGWIVSRHRNTRCLAMSISQFPGLIGLVLLYVLPDSNKSGKVGSYYTRSTHSISLSLMMAMLSANYAGLTNKTTASALPYMSWCAGQIIAPQLYKEHVAPRYPTAFHAQFIVLPLVSQAYLMWSNRTRYKHFPGVVDTSRHKD